MRLPDLYIFFNKNIASSNCKPLGTGVPVFGQFRGDKPSISKLM